MFTTCYTNTKFYYFSLIFLGPTDGSYSIGTNGLKILFDKEAINIEENLNTQKANHHHINEDIDESSGSVKDIHWKGRWIKGRSNLGI